MDTRLEPSPADRRSQPRGGARNLMRDGVFRLLRLIGRHVQGFYGAVGVFLIIVIALTLVPTITLAVRRRTASS